MNTVTMCIHLQMSCNIWKLDIFIFFCISTYTPVCHISVNNSHLIPQKWNSVCFFIIISSSSMSPGLVSYASKVYLKATSSIHRHCWHMVRLPAPSPLHHSHSSAFLFPLSFLHRTLQPLQPFQDNLLCPTLKAFSGILFLEEIKVKCLSITCFQPHFSLFIFQDAPLPWVRHPHRRHHLCALCFCISTCILR